MDVELDDIPVHSLVPEALRGVASVDEFMARLPDFDGELAEQLAAADAAGECLRFVGARTLPPGAAQLLWRAAVADWGQAWVVRMKMRLGGVLLGPTLL